MSKWTHAICVECWQKRNPGRVPHQGTTIVAEKCCFCGNETRSGIYVRHDPAELKCRGKHGEE